MFLIVFGTKHKYKKDPNAEWNEFCSKCMRYTKFNVVMHKEYFSLFLIPIFPIRSKGKLLLECSECHSRYGMTPQSLAKYAEFTKQIINHE